MGEWRNYFIFWLFVALAYGNNGHLKDSGQTTEGYNVIHLASNLVHNENANTNLHSAHGTTSDSKLVPTILENVDTNESTLSNKRLANASDAKLQHPTEGLEILVNTVSHKSPDLTEYDGNSVTELQSKPVSVTVTGILSDYNDYDMVVETLVSTTTHTTHFDHRVQRTIADSLSTFMSVDASAVPGDERRKSNRMAAAGPDIDDIIQGIMNLLGANVKIDASAPVDTRLTTFEMRPPNITSTRINDRAPPRLPEMPFGLLPTPPSFNPASLIRPPIVHPPKDKLTPPGMPAFMANTRPPFMAALPPAFRPRPPHFEETGLPSQNPFKNEIPIPESLIPELHKTTSTPLLFITKSTSTNLFPSLLGTDNLDLEDLMTHFNITFNNATLDENAFKTENKTDELAIETPHEGESTLTKEISDLEEATEDEELVLESSLDNSMLTSTVLSSTAESSSEILSTVPQGIIDTKETSRSVVSTITVDEVQSSMTENTSKDDRASTNVVEIATVNYVTKTMTPIRSIHSRPGLVMNENYRPGHVIAGTVLPTDDLAGEIFDITVSAYHGIGGGGFSNGGRPHSGAHYVPVNAYGEQIIATPVGSADGYVSIDGRKTYFDLLPTEVQQIQPQTSTGTGVGIVIPEEEMPSHEYINPAWPSQAPSTRTPSPPRQPPSPRPQPPRAYTRRPKPPPIRIDTCIVGDDSTCAEEHGEVCRTEGDVSSCYCRPGTGRQRPRTPCKKTVSLLMSVKVDKIGEQRISWNGNYGNPKSEEYRILEWEAKHAIDSAMRKTQMGSMYLGNQVHKFYSIGGKVIVNSTVMLQDSDFTRAGNLKERLQRQMIQVIQSHGSYIGASPLSVDGPLNPIPDIRDLNECSEEKLNDCHKYATCLNDYGSFTCQCRTGYSDKSKDPEKKGRHCESCSADYCYKRGECSIELGQKVCECRGSFYGARCEIDGEVLGVAVGASVAAVIIIILTLIFLCMWSRKWKAQDQKTEFISRAAGLFGGLSVRQKTAGKPRHYAVSMEDRIRWAQMADPSNGQNIYAPSSSNVGDNSGGFYTMNSSDYLTTGLSGFPFSVYNRVTRALSNPVRQKVGWVERFRKMYGRPSRKQKGVPTYMMGGGHATYNPQQMMALSAKLAVQHQTEHMGTAGPSGSKALLFNNSQLGANSSAAYASLGDTGQYSQFPQHFGLQHLNPVNLNTLGPVFPGNASYAQSGVSRAPTLGARTPLPIRTGHGGPTVGPMGGASVIGGPYCPPESSEDDVERPYYLPRPKSRTSLADSSDVYYEPDEIPQFRPPPLPHPQTFNMAFFQ